MRARRILVVAVAGVTFAFAGMGAESCGNTATSDEPNEEQEQSAESSKSGETKAAPKSKWDEAQEGIEEIWGDDLRDVSRADNVIQVKNNVADNFNNGAILGGQDRKVGDTFKLIYADVGMNPQRVVVDGYFPLVNKSTGKESTDVVTTHEITRGDAAEVVWDNADTIDWDSYRTFKHYVFN